MNMQHDMPILVAGNIRVIDVISKRTGQLHGTGFKVPTHSRIAWRPRASIEVDLLLDKAKDRRRHGHAIEPRKVEHRKNKHIEKVGPCAFGCRTTTYTDISGNNKWQGVPAAAKHLVPGEVSVCQRCYTSLLRGVLPKGQTHGGRPPEDSGA